MSNTESKELSSSKLLGEAIKNKIETETEDITSKICNTLGIYFNYMRDKVNKISLRELSKRSGISIALISAFEDGKKLPRIETLIRLMLPLNIPFNEVFGNKLSGLANNFNYTNTTKEDNSLREFLSTQGYDKDEVKEIINFTNYIKYKRG